jgi:hypothetical protein
MIWILLASDGSCFNTGLALVCTVIVMAVAFTLAGAVDDSKF